MIEGPALTTPGANLPLAIVARRQQSFLKQKRKAICGAVGPEACQTILMCRQWDTPLFP
jgi:hypothetical protein